MFIIKIKKAMQNEGLYNGTLDANWENVERTAWLNFCNRFGGNYTPEPTFYNQTVEFRSLIDNTDITEYNVPQAPTTSGIDVRQLIPERIKLENVEGLSKEHIKRIDAMVNENVIKPGDSFIPDKPTSKITPEEAVRIEKLYNKEAVVNKMVTEEPLPQATTVTTIRTR